MIGWEDDDNIVGPVAVAAKQSLLRLIPHIMPADSSHASLYRLVVDHGDFGIHNMSITMDANGNPLVTSLYDWETGCIVPTILSDPLMAVAVDLVTDENAKPSITRVPSDATPSDHVQYMEWTRHYFEVRPSFLYININRALTAVLRLRLSSIERPTTSVQYRQAKTHATSGLRCESGEAKIQRDILVIWEIGLK